MLLKNLVNLITAIGRQGQIGLNGKLPWHDPDDLKWFKSTTMGCPVVVGHKTWKTLPPLPGRFIFVDDRQTDPEELIKHISTKHPNKDIWIIGGRATYKKYMPFVKRFYISRVDYDGPADTYFPLNFLG